MNINSANYVTFGNSYAYQLTKDNPEEFYSLSTDSKLNAIFDMLNVNGNTIIDNQKIITQNQESIQDANRRTFKAISRDCDLLDINHAFNYNKINVIG